MEALVQIEVARLLANFSSDAKYLISTIAQGVERELQQVESRYVEAGRTAAASGRPLDAAKTGYATRLGIARPDRVRVVVADRFPVPDDPSTAAITSAYGLGSAAEGGRTHEFTVFVKPAYASKSWLLRHELVHVRQIEQMGVDAFLRRYLVELKTVGYSRAPLEVEANLKSRSASGG